MCTVQTRTPLLQAIVFTDPGAPGGRRAAADREDRSGSGQGAVRVAPPDASRIIGALVAGLRAMGMELAPQPAGAYIAASGVRARIAGQAHAGWDAVPAVPRVLACALRSIASITPPGRRPVTRKRISHVLSCVLALAG